MFISKCISWFIPVVVDTQIESLSVQEIFQAQVISRRQAEFDRINAEREERISQVIQARKHAREIKRKQIYYLTCEEERITKQQEEEEARKREEAEKRKKEEAERKAKLDEIAEKQRQREIELEERERIRREALLRGIDAPPARLVTEPTVTTTPPVAVAASAGTSQTPAAAPGPAKYVPRFKRQTTEVAGPSAPTPTPAVPETDRWSNRGPPPPADDHWGSSRGGASSQRSDRWTGGRERAGPPPAEGADRWVGGPRGSDRPTGSSFGSSKPRPTQR